MNPDVSMAGPFATVRETHIGVVFLIGELAYKLKKPVRTAFLDFSTRQRRLDACLREVELNRRLAADSVEELRRFRGTVLDNGLVAELERRALRFLAGREPLLAARQRAGRIVDGHGDLLTGDIFCLDDGPRVLDCLEFDDRLRYVDGLDDAAFLAMDLEYRGAAELGARFLDWYAEFAGDPAPPALASSLRRLPRGGPHEGGLPAQ